MEEENNSNRRPRNLQVFSVFISIELLQSSRTFNQILYLNNSNYIIIIKIRN